MRESDAAVLIGFVVVRYWLCGGVSPRAVSVMLACRHVDLVTGFAENCEPPSLNLFYQTMMLQHKQIQSDNKKAKVASKQLQISVRKIAKTCSEIGEHIATMETGTSMLETDMGAVAQESVMHESQLIDIQWKMEDFENHQRRNYLRIFVIEEGVEGQNIRVYIVKLLKNAFPELEIWD
ncbi:hypothetical protein NDU88_006142 [Pleurodeles waltl]|uniref:Uncharacterized protein n=1 Tax=Pleurodeles waltl TaxID=8319 RepID=A0AAV7NTB9_PLEWA|nr:hypothetical protein NDU88_006142 [Pleurodeles waltl]